MIANRRTYWECSKRSSENGYNVKITVDAPNKFVAQTHRHSHAADPEGNDL